MDFLEEIENMQQAANLWWLYYQPCSIFTRATSRNPQNLGKKDLRAHGGQFSLGQQKGSSDELKGVLPPQKQVCIW